MRMPFEYYKREVERDYPEISVRLVNDLRHTAHYNPQEQEIVISKERTERIKILALFHELGHYLCGHSNPYGTQINIPVIVCFEENAWDMGLAYANKRFGYTVTEKDKCTIERYLNSYKTIKNYLDGYDYDFEDYSNI